MPERAPDPRTARTRAAILQATAELLGTADGATTSIAQIARQAGVSVGSVYVHFDSKDALVSQLIELAWARRRPDFDAVRDLESPLDRVFAFGDALLAFAAAEPVAYRALRLRAIDPPSLSATIEPGLFGPPLEFLRSDLAEAMDRGEIATGDPQTLAAVLVATWTGLGEQLVRRDTLGLDGAAAEAARRLARGVLGAGLSPAVVAG